MFKEATAKRKKQIERCGYVEDIKDFGQKFSVQLASNYVKTPAKCAKNATDKMWWQYKLDGLKGYYENGKMMSRKGVIYNRIHEDLLKQCELLKQFLITKYNMINPILDGELFIDSSFWLEDLNSIVSGGETLSGIDKEGKEFFRIGPNDITLQVCNIYDESIKDMKYEDVIPIIKNSITLCGLPRIGYCASAPFTFEDAEKSLDFAIGLGEEGIVIYMNTPYKAGKHNGVWKYKRMKDAEWEIIGVKETKTLTDKDGGKIKQFQYVCKTVDNLEFSVRMEGTNAHRESIGNGENIGKLLKIKYQGLYKTGKPQFPVGVNVRLPEDI